MGCYTGAMAFPITLENDEEIFVVSINSDVYDTLSDAGYEYIKYFVIAHEIGHCLNGDSYKSHERTIKCELQADTAGYEEVIKSGFFGDFEFDSKWVMSVESRRIQHILQLVFMIFGKENADLIMKTYGIKTYPELFRKFWLDDDRYAIPSPEDIERRMLFENIFLK